MRIFKYQLFWLCLACVYRKEQMKQEWVLVNSRWHRTTNDGKYLRCNFSFNLEWNGRVMGVSYTENPPPPACKTCAPRATEDYRKEWTEKVKLYPH